ncbi:Uma2 family endonuclease [Streptomyces pristinaespiralis]|uniref:Uma2 family endonuclease n=1 Tax=Streptomyces pristinaespiralis TaxID=38300 RepID=UPI0037A34A24
MGRDRAAAGREAALGRAGRCALTRHSLLGRLLPRRPRDVARLIARTTDLRVEILAGSLVLSRTDCPTRAVVVRQLAAGIEEHMTVVEAPSVRMPMDPDDFVVPDLAAIAGVTDPADRTVQTKDVQLAVEVVPRQWKGPGGHHKEDWYAVACVRALLIVDPRDGTWRLCRRPRDGRYREVRSGAYGDEVALPVPLSFLLTTRRLPRYASGGPPAAR